MVSTSRVVAQQKRRGSIVPNQNVQAAVIVIITDRQSSSRKRSRKCGSRFRADVAQTPLFLMKQEKRFLIVHLRGILIDHVIRVAVSENQIDGAVIIVIEVLQSPAAQESCSLRDALPMRDVR